MRVFVYYNLHRKLWSIKALEGENKGKVIAHRDSVMLLSPEGKVSQAGRNRVLKERRKNVHAGLVGKLLDQDTPWGFDMWDEITYNPYKYDSFVYKDNEGVFDGASLAWMQDRKVYVI